MKIVIVAVGRIKEPGLREILDDYVVRAGRYVSCSEVEVRDDSALVRALPKDGLVVALDVGGEMLTSTDFARRLERWGRLGKGVIVFLVGGAEGLSPEASRVATERISLSKMTLPHRLARVVLAEQVYRAMTILRGEPYAR